MLVIALLCLLAVACVITELMLTDGVRAGKYNNPNVATKVVRGTIYDRNGRALALEIPKNRLYIEPDVQDKDIMSQVLSLYLGKTPGEILDLLNKAQNTGERVLLADDVDQKTLSQINSELDRNGLLPLSTEKEYTRTYPADFSAAQLIEETEAVYDKVLSPAPGFGESTTYGNDVYLALDLDIQYLLDLAVQDLYEIQSPDYAVAFVVDIKTGELLASTTYPFYDLNDSAGIPDSQKVNRTLVGSINRPDIRIAEIKVVDKVTKHNTNETVDSYTLDGNYTKDLDAVRTLVREQDGSSSLMLLMPEEQPKYIVFMGTVNPRFYKIPSVLEMEMLNLEKGLASQSKI